MGGGALVCSLLVKTEGIKHTGVGRFRIFGGGGGGGHLFVAFVDDRKRATIYKIQKSECVSECLLVCSLLVMTEGIKHTGVGRFRIFRGGQGLKV